jgi:hypothetical protein
MSDGVIGSAWRISSGLSSCSTCTTGSTSFATHRSAGFTAPTCWDHTKRTTWLAVQLLVPGMSVQNRIITGRPVPALTAYVRRREWHLEFEGEDGRPDDDGAAILQDRFRSHSTASATATAPAITTHFTTGR